MFLTKKAHKENEGAELVVTDIDDDDMNKHK